MITIGFGRNLLFLFQDGNNSAYNSTTDTGPKSTLKSNSKSLPKDIVSIHFLCFVKIVSISQYIKVSMPIIKYPPLALKKFGIYAGISISAFPWLDKRKFNHSTQNLVGRVPVSSYTISANSPLMRSTEFCLICLDLFRRLKTSALVNVSILIPFHY